VSAGEGPTCSTCPGTCPSGDALPLTHILQLGRGIVQDLYPYPVRCIWKMLDLGYIFYLIQLEISCAYAEETQHLDPNAGTRYCSTCSINEKIKSGCVSKSSCRNTGDFQMLESI
jgi:hypothetical protein